MPTPSSPTPQNPKAGTSKPKPEVVLDPSRPKTPALAETPKPTAPTTVPGERHTQQVMDISTPKADMKPQPPAVPHPAASRVSEKGVRVVFLDDTGTNHNGTLNGDRVDLDNGRVVTGSHESLHEGDKHAWTRVPATPATS